MAAILTALNAGLAPRAAYARGTVPGLSGAPGVEPPIYGVVDLERRDGDAPLRSARTTRRAWRVTLRGVGRTVSEAQWALARMSAAVEGVSLTVGSAQTSPLIFEAAEGVAPDDGRYSGSITYTYGT